MRCILDIVAPFALNTKQGYMIVDTYQYKGKTYIIGFRPGTINLSGAPGDYFIGYGYNPIDGTWMQGEYGYRLRSQAQERLIKYLAE